MFEAFPQIQRLQLASLKFSQGENATQVLTGYIKDNNHLKQLSLKVCLFTEEAFYHLIHLALLESTVETFEMIQGNFVQVGTRDIDPANSPLSL